VPETEAHIVPTTPEASQWWAAEGQVNLSSGVDEVGETVSDRDMRDTGKSGRDFEKASGRRALCQHRHQSRTQLQNRARQPGACTLEAFSHLLAGEYNWVVRPAATGEVPFDCVRVVSLILPRSSKEVTRVQGKATVTRRPTTPPVTEGERVRIASRGISAHFSPGVRAPMTSPKAVPQKAPPSIARGMTSAP